MQPVNRTEFQHARRMARMLARLEPKTDRSSAKQYTDWEAAWRACLHGIRALYGPTVMCAISSSVFPWRDLAQRRYQWSTINRGFRFSELRFAGRLRQRVAEVA